LDKRIFTGHFSTSSTALVFIYPYSNQVLATGRWCWSA